MCQQSASHLKQQAAIRRRVSLLPSGQTDICTYLHMKYIELRKETLPSLLLILLPPSACFSVRFPPFRPVHCSLPLASSPPKDVVKPDPIKLHHPIQ